MRYTLGFSPCPNDTFIFDALVNGGLELHGPELDVRLEDVETLNRWALEGKLDITKLSYGVLPAVMHTYQVLDSGSALGSGVGPLLITRESAFGGDVAGCPVALPGEHTTAHLLFSLAYPEARQKIFLRYDEIESFVSAGKGLGVIIHENRFTYAAKGLHNIMDLGHYWETQTGCPVPLGGIAVKRSLPEAHKKLINEAIRASIRQARKAYPALSAYIRDHAREMEENVMRQHIDLYVNDYSLSLGPEGRAAVKRLLAAGGSGSVAGAAVPADLFTGY